jgi:hypothetical protein
LSGYKRCPKIYAAEVEDLLAPAAATGMTSL